MISSFIDSILLWKKLLSAMIDDVSIVAAKDACNEVTMYPSVWEDGR